MTEQLSTDRRIIRTKEAIRDALISLMEEKGFEAVSVMDITTRANINRGTFYLHYQDKYDLLEQIQAGILKDFTAMVSKASAMDFTVTLSTDEPLPLIVMMLEYIDNNAALMHAVLGLKGAIGLQTQIKKTIEQNLLVNGPLAKILNEENLIVPINYFISYVASAHLGVIQEWLQSGRNETPKEMALFLSKLSFYGPMFALGLVRSQ
jgi:AcrR family transcriptional regulator